MKAWARGELACIKANLPPGAEEFAAGNGEGVWVLVDKATETLHDKDGVGTAPAYLANWPVTYPQMGWGDPLQIELRGEKRAVARPESLQGPVEQPEFAAEARYLEHEAPQWWPDAGEAGRADPVRDYWYRQWGLATEAWFFNLDRRLPVPPFRVLEFNPKPGVWCYATVGMSQKPMRSEQGDLRAELFAMGHSESMEMVYRLANLATFPFAESTHLDWGHTVTDDRGETLMLDAPDLEGDTIDVEEGLRARLMRVLPLRPAELALRQASGTEALRERLYAKDCDLLDWERPSTVQD